MKIIQVIPSFGMGGAETMCENLIYTLRKSGHEVIAVSLYNQQSAITQRLDKNGVNIRFLNKKPGLDFSMFKKLRSIFEKEKPDVVHTHLYTTKYVFPVAVGMKIKAVHTVHNDAKKELPWTTRRFNEMFFRLFDVVPVALSKKIQQTIIEEYKLRENDVPIVFNGVDLSKCIVKDTYKYSSSFKIVHVGRFSKQKNHKTLIEAFEKFNKKHTNSELHLIGDGPERASIEEIVSKKKLNDKIFFHGSQSSVFKYLTGMDIFTLPSLWEGLPMSIIEAMGTGLPIVASNVGGIPDIIDDSCSLLVSPVADDIALAYEKYYQNETLRQQHGENALARSKEFSSEIMGEKYINIYLGGK